MQTGELAVSSHRSPHSPWRRWGRQWSRAGLRVLSVLLLLGIWQLATGAGWISPLFLPPPSKVLSEGAKVLTSGDLLLSVVVSMRRVFTGYALAIFVGVPLGIMMGVWEPVKAFLDPLISLLRPLPSMTWVPLTMLWFGIGESQKYAIVFLGSVIYVLLYTFESTRQVDPLLIRAARNLGAGDLDVMREVVLPGALPGIIAGLKVTLAISWTCVLSAELVAANKGLGALIWFAKDWNNMALVMVGMVSISLTVLVIDTVFRFIEVRILPWQRGRV